MKLPFRQAAVYYFWNLHFQKKFRTSKDPFESAKNFISAHGSTHLVEPMTLEEVPGTKALAFTVMDFMNEWVSRTQELGLDSTCELQSQVIALNANLLKHKGNTNGQNYELFAAVAEANGVGLPLAYLFIQTTEAAAEGSKQAIIEQFLRRLKEKGVNPEFTLTDKDWSEINAMNAVYPCAKHQLCFWHALRALKKRLASRNQRPGAYNPSEAAEEFSFIKTDFVPSAQMENAEEVSQ